MSVDQVLPSEAQGRGTMRSMVEGPQAKRAGALAARCPAAERGSPSADLWSPPPLRFAGEEFR